MLWTWHDSDYSSLMLKTYEYPVFLVRSKRELNSLAMVVDRTCTECMQVNIGGGIPTNCLPTPGRVPESSATCEESFAEEQYKTAPSCLSKMDKKYAQIILSNPKLEM